MGIARISIKLKQDYNNYIKKIILIQFVAQGWACAPLRYSHVCLCLNMTFLYLKTLKLSGKLCLREDKLSIIYNNVDTSWYY